MKLQFFTIPAKWPEEAQLAINAFCSQHRVMTMEKHFVDIGETSYWSICVTYIDSSGQLPAGVSGNRRDTIDYKEVLNDQDFAVYAQLRELRKSLAAQEGVPTYVLFTNEQLAEMVTRRVLTESEMAGIEGVGKARLEKYSVAFLRLLNTALTSQTVNNHASSAD